MPVKTKTKTKTKTKASPPGTIVWGDAPTELTRRCSFTLIYGDTGTGRTTLALTAPGPIAFLTDSDKIEGIVQRFAHKIGPHGDGRGGMLDFNVSLNGSPEEISSKAMPVWKRVREAWFDALNWARTIVLDTDTSAYELIRYGYFGDLAPSEGRIDRNWGPINADWKSMLRSFRAQDKTNVVLVSQTEDEYKESKKGIGKRTGRTIRKGQKSVPYIADVIARTEKYIGIGEDVGKTTFTATVEKGWWNAHSEGLEFENEMMAFPTIMSLVTETDEEEWK